MSRRRWITRGGVVALAVVTMLGAQPASAAPGDHDPSFGVDGTSKASVGLLSDVYIRSSGKVVSAGWNGRSIIVEKRRRNGSLDRTFNKNGRFVFSEDLLNGDDSARFDSEVFVAGQGQSIIVGFSYDELEFDEGFPIRSGSSHLLRLTDGGRIDRSFGTNGIVTLPSGSRDYSRITDMVVDGRGNITVAQQRWSHSFSGRPEYCTPETESCDYSDQAAIVRITVDGNRSRTFGKRGSALLTSNSSQIEPVAIARSGSGWALLYADIGTDDTTYEVARFTAKGKRDDAFSGGGTASVTNVGSDDVAFDIVGRPGGGLIVGIDRLASPYGISHLALKDNGERDRTFSDDSVASTGSGLDMHGMDMVVDADGTIYTSTYVVESEFENSGVVVATRSNGKPRASFGTDGSVEFDRRESLTAPAIELWGDHDAVLVASTSFTDPSGDNRILFARIDSLAI